jgi:hypothetical protein
MVVENIEEMVDRLIVSLSEPVRCVIEIAAGHIFCATIHVLLPDTTTVRL